MDDDIGINGKRLVFEMLAANRPFPADSNIYEPVKSALTLTKTDYKKHLPAIQLLETAFAAVPDRPLGLGPTADPPEFLSALDRVELAADELEAVRLLLDIVHRREIRLMATKARGAAKQTLGRMLADTNRNLATAQSEFRRRLARRAVGRAWAVFKARLQEIGEW
jgi:predicted DNA-binding protein (UPF0251 family)